MDLRHGVPNAVAILLILCTLSPSLDASATGFRGGRGEHDHLRLSRRGRRRRSCLETRWLYEEWLVAHDVSYGGPREKERRFDVFKENLRLIDEHNRPENNHSYVLGLNRFAGLTNEEFASLYLSAYGGGGNTSAGRTATTQPAVTSDRYAYADGDILPNCVDWRSRGAVGPVKDQGRCKSCWAFSAVAAIEGINYITVGRLVTLSEQQILDCEMWNVGCCKTGYTHNAYEFVMMNGGIDTDRNYPYHKKKEKCKWNSESAVSIAQYGFIPRNSESSLQKAVASQPISVVVASHCLAFQFYKSGIFDGACGEKMRHSMVVVGYGTEDGKDYWIVKNSWGEEWGEAGYMRMERNIGDPAGKCGITTYASYPIMCPTNS